MRPITTHLVAEEPARAQQNFRHVKSASPTDAGHVSGPTLGRPRRLPTLPSEIALPERSGSRVLRPWLLRRSAVGRTLVRLPRRCQSATRLAATPPPSRLCRSRRWVASPCEAHSPSRAPPDRRCRLPFDARSPQVRREAPLSACGGDTPKADIATHEPCGGAELWYPQCRRSPG